MMADLASRYLIKGTKFTEIIRLLGFEYMKTIEYDAELHGSVGGIDLLFYKYNEDKNNKFENYKHIINLDKSDASYLYYIVGSNAWFDTCTLNISFNKNGLLEKAFYYCD